MDDKKTPTAGNAANVAPTQPAADAEAADSPSPDPAPNTARPKEIGGPKGPEPTRFGDWERNGRCSDF
ncbi:MAG: succinate dehydrogenase assembly factor 4 [Pseudomonadota bacterium]